MKKESIVFGLIPILCAGAIIFEAIGFTANNSLKAAVGSSDYFSITINAEDVTTSTSPTSDSCVVYTDQLHNEITFNYENIIFEQDGENKYLVFGEEAFFGNDKNSQIRSIQSITVYGDGDSFAYDYGWSIKAGSILYTGDNHYGSTDGTSIAFGINQPNYITLMHRDGGADAKISKIVITYDKDCVIGVKPVLQSIALNGQTTSFNRGNTFSFGGNVTAYYSNGTTANVTSKTTFSGYNMSTSGTYTVTASYTEQTVTKTATYKLTVNKVWTTIWSGSKSISHNGSPVAIINPNLTGSQTFRVTWTGKASAGGSATSTVYYNNGNETTTKPGSPLQFTIDTSSNQLRRIGIGRKYSSSVDMAVLDYRPYSSSTRPGFYLNVYQTNGTIGDTVCDLTITKIERYY